MLPKLAAKLTVGHTVAASIGLLTARRKMVLLPQNVALLKNVPQSVTAVLREVESITQIVESLEQYLDRVPPHCVHGPTQCTPKSENTKNSTLSYTIKMDPINAALAALELQDHPNYAWTAKEFNVNYATLSRHHQQTTHAREDATEMKSLLSIQ